MTRSGSVYPIELSDEVLQKAMSNTVEYLVKHVEVTADTPRTEGGTNDD